jgi:ParB-like chromosome segregation protein Spo0J
MDAIATIPLSLLRERADSRAIEPATITALTESIREIGLLAPITVRTARISDGVRWVDGYELIAGNHRVRAVKALGWTDIDAVVVALDDVDAELSMIAENLHRSELSALQRDEQIARWILLTEARRRTREVLPHPVAKPEGGRPECGVRAAARELGINREDARRAVAVASLSPEAKGAAIEAGLDDNRTALLAAAKEPTPERQVAKVKEWDAAREVELAKRAVARKAAKANAAIGATSSLDEDADALALFLVEHLPVGVHREAVERLASVSSEAAKAFAALALPDVPFGLTVSVGVSRVAA